MSIPTLQLTKIAKRWKDILHNSQRLREYCVEKYKKPPTIFVGVNGKKFPDSRHCPAIFILPGIKTEGLMPAEYPYALTISWSVLQQDVVVDGVRQKWSECVNGELIEFLGVYESDDFGQLVMSILQEELMDDWPISKIDYNIDTQEYYPQWPGFAVLTTEIEPAIGEELHY